MAHTLNRLWASFLVLLTICLCFSGCSCDDGEETAAAKVYMTPATVDVSPGEQVEIAVHVSPEGGVSGCEIHLAFNSTAMEMAFLQPGDLLGINPLTGISERDDEAGTAQYALARKGSTTAPTSPGVFATIILLVSETVEGGTYELSLTQVNLVDESFKDIEDVSAEGALIHVIVEE